MVNNSWATERTEMLKALHAEGKTGKEIACALGCTKSMVIGKLHRLGMRLGPDDPRGRPRAPPPARPPAPAAHPWRQQAASRPPKVPLDAVSPATVPAALPRTRVNIYGLTTLTCRWPLWGNSQRLPTSKQFYCGAPTGSGPYCARHAAAAYRPSSWSCNQDRLKTG